MRPEKIPKHPEFEEHEDDPPSQDLYGFCANTVYCNTMKNYLWKYYKVSSTVATLDKKLTGQHVFVCDGDDFLNNQWVTTICDAMKYLFPEYVLYPIQINGDAALLYARPPTGL